MKTCETCHQELDEKAPQFIYILSTAGGLLGLSAEGTVWVYCDAPKYGWRELPTRIVPQGSRPSKYYREGHQRIVDYTNFDQAPERL